MIEAESIKFVERRHVAKRIVALIRDLLLADQFLLRPRQLVVRQALGGEFADFIQKGALHRLDFFRIGAEIKSEETRDQALHLAGPDIIGEAHLLADANEKTRAEIAARFVDQFERITIGTKNIAPRKPTIKTPCAFSFCFYRNLFSLGRRRWRIASKRVRPESLRPAFARTILALRSAFTFPKTEITPFFATT